ncbi:tetratricopeptide repeat protein [Deinococcus sp.]|uniref:tetratricopeptide repeat protein n=1 Tax=Deinococcus sp. TaxID=47478 RepID=UPI002869971B|nr:tetratricopeptide repeat protein [Deinococcus sp.]
MDEIERGWRLFTQDRFSEAESIFLTVLATAQVDDEQNALARSGLGYCFAYTGRFDDARAEFRAVRQHALTDANRFAEHRALHQIGMVERMAGDWHAALACFEEERRMIGELGDHDLAVAVNAYELGLVALNLGWVGESRQHFETSLLAAQRTDDLIAVACAHRGLGDWHAASDGRQEAKPHWQKALRLFQDAEDRQGVQGVVKRLEGTE